MTIDNLVQQLRAAHGDALLGVLVYGSTATDPGATRGHSVLVVVRTLDVAALRAAGAIATAWHEAGNPAPLTLTEAEWKSSRDVFAIEHADIAERHRLLYAAHGFAPEPRAAVRDADIRRQVEYELLALTLGVRAAIAAAGRDAKAQRAVLAANASRATALMRAILRLERRPVPADAESVCREIEALTGTAAAPFVTALAQRRGHDVSRPDLDAALAGFHGGLAALVAWVDARPTSD
jgi:hypothetical protein